MHRHQLLKATTRSQRKIMNLIEDVGTSEIITVGGYGTGDVVEDPDVFGAVTTENVKERI